MSGTALLKRSELVAVDVDDLACCEESVAHGAHPISAGTFDSCFNLRPAGAGVLAHLLADQLGDRLVVELLALLDGKTLALCPEEAHRDAMLRAGPARLLEEEARAPVALALDMAERVAGGFPGARDLARLRLVVNQHDGQAPAGQSPKVVDQHHKVANLLQRPGLVHPGARHRPGD